MRIIPYLILLIFVSVMIILPVSADNETLYSATFDHTEYRYTGTDSYHFVGDPWGANTYGVNNKIKFHNVQNAQHMGYVILSRSSSSAALEYEGHRTITFTNGLRANAYTTYHRNIAGTITLQETILYFDNWEEHVPDSGSYIITIESVSAGEPRFSSLRAAYNGALKPSIPSDKCGAVSCVSTYSYIVSGISVLCTPIYSGTQTINVSITDVRDISHSISVITDRTEYSEWFLSSTTEYTESFIMGEYQPSLSHTEYRDYLDDMRPTRYLTSVLAGVNKQWEIHTPLSDDEPTPTPETGYTVNKINAPPYYVGGEVIYKLGVGSGSQEIPQRIEFATNYQGNLYDTTTYFRNEGEDTFHIGYMGEYTFDELQYYFEPDRVGDYTTTVTVTDDSYSQVFTYTDTVSVQESDYMSFLRLETKSSYDNSFISGASLRLSWDGEEKVNQSLPSGVYEGNIPKNSVITANVTKTGYLPREVQGHFTDDAYNNWLIVLTPSEAPTPESDECLVEFTVTDGINPLPNARIMFDTGAKYTNQLGLASYITDDIGLKTYSVTLTGYQGASGALTTIANTTISKTVVLSPLSITPTITPSPSISPTPTPSGNITYPAVGEEGWGIITAVKYLIATFLGVTDEKWVDAFLALCIIITSSIVVVQYTRDAGGAMVGAGIGFLISLVIGLIPLWIVFVMLALGGFTAFLMMSRGS